MPIDPDADSSRRAWLPCPSCHHGHGCRRCQNNHNCQTHWQYLLKNEGTRVSLQCPTCAHLWTVDLANARTRTPIVATIPLDGYARQLVAGPTGEYMFATTARSVNVIDRRHRVIASVPLDVEPKHTMVSPDGSRIYVTGDDGSVSIINAMDYTVRTVVRDASTSAVVSPDDHYVYLAHSQGHNCWVSVMSDDGTTVSALPVDSYASALALSPDGGRLYVASSRPKTSHRYGHGSISVIDTSNFTLIHAMALHFSPDTLTVSHDGSMLYATHYNKNAISAIDLASHTQTLIRLDDAPLDVVASGDGAHLYVANLHSLALIDTATNIAESVPIGDLPRLLHISGDGRQAYVADFGRNSVWVMDPVDKTIINMVDLGRDAEVLALHTGDELVYVADYSKPTLTVVSLAREGRVDAG